MNSNLTLEQNVHGVEIFSSKLTSLLGKHVLAYAGSPYLFRSGEPLIRSTPKKTIQVRLFVPVDPVASHCHNNSSNNADVINKTLVYDRYLIIF